MMNWIRMVLGCSLLVVLQAVFQIFLANYSLANLYPDIQYNRPGNSTIEVNLKYTTPSVSGKFVVGEHTTNIRFLTIIILTWTRHKPLSRLLQSLAHSDYGNDIVDLEIHVDGGYGVDWQTSIATSKGFNWTFGQKKVVVADSNGGLANAWFTAWDPDSLKTKFVMILEDDLEVSRIWYTWTKMMWRKYEDVSNIAGLSLQYQTFCAAKGNHKSIVNNHQPFAYKLNGAWGFSPHPRHWKEFLKIDFRTHDPSVEGLMTSVHYKSYKKGSVWTQHFNWFANTFNLYTLHLNPSDATALAINHKEPGEHFETKEAPDFQLVTVWNDEWKPPSVLQYYGWNCEIISVANQISSYSSTESRTPFNKFLQAHQRNCVSMSVFTPDPERIKRYALKVPETITTIQTFLGSTWEVFLYYDDSVQESLKRSILLRAKSAGIQIHMLPMTRSHVLSGTFWRYYTFDKCSFTIMRDAELPFEKNDLWAYNHFMEMPQELAFIQLAHARTWKDHRPVLGGTYMMKNIGRRLNMTQLLNEWPFWHYYGSDEVFMGNIVHPKRKSIVYYEPRKRVANAVKLSGMELFETYVKLPTCYQSAGAGEC